MKIILIIKLLITLSIINHLKISSNINYTKLDIDFIKHLVQDKLEILFPTAKISDLLYLVELILSEIKDGNFNFENNNKLSIQTSLDFVDSISLEITIEESELTKLVSSDNPNNSELVVLECLKRLSSDNKDVDFIDFPISIYFDSSLNRHFMLNHLNDKSGIYCWYSKLSGNMYVGSAVNLRARTSDYYQASYIENREHLPIIKAMKKYGMENFSLIILEYTNKNNLIRSEQYWIDFITPEYNILSVAGSWANHHHSEDAKSKISDYRTGKTHTEEVKKLISLTRQKENNPFFGKTHSEETKNLMRIAQSSRTVDPNPGIAINLYSSENELLQTFKSIRETAKYFKADTRTINRYLNSNKLFRGEYYLRNKDI